MVSVPEINNNNNLTTKQNPIQIRLQELTLVRASRGVLGTQFSGSGCGRRAVTQRTSSDWFQTAVPQGEGTGFEPPQKANPLKEGKTETKRGQPNINNAQYAYCRPSSLVDYFAGSMPTLSLNWSDFCIYIYT